MILVGTVYVPLSTTFQNLRTFYWYLFPDALLGGDFNVNLLIPHLPTVTHLMDMVEVLQLATLAGGELVIFTRSISPCWLPF